MNNLLNRISGLTIRSSNHHQIRNYALKSSSLASTRGAGSSHGDIHNPISNISNINGINSKGVKSRFININDISIRHQSTAHALTSNNNNNKNNNDDKTIIAIGPDGTKYSIPMKPLGPYQKHRHAPKLPPHIVKKRIKHLRIMTGAARQIRHSPWRLNLICQFVAGQTVNDALRELPFVNKVKAPLVQSLVQGTANSAMTKHGLLKSQLEIVECFATQGTHLKRIKTMGRGRAGKMYRRFTHIRIVLREIDFPLKIMQCTSINQRNQWVKKMELAKTEVEEYQVEKEEIEALEREAEAVKKQKEV